MHMISKKDLISDELETVTTSRSPMTVITANGEMQTNEEATVYVKELAIFSTMRKSSRTRQQYCRSESFSMKTDTHMNGSTVKNHISLKTGFGYSAIRKISYQSWFLVYQRVLPQARLPQHPRLVQVRKLIIQITIQQTSQVKVWIDQHGETRSLLKHHKSCYMNQPKSQKQNKNKDPEQVRGNCIQTYQNGCKNSERMLWMKEFLNTEIHTQVLLMNHL